MKQKIYQIDAFTTKLFGGNPAAVCILDEWLANELMQKIAAENNLAETAFAFNRCFRTTRYFKSDRETTFRNL